MLLNPVIPPDESALRRRLNRWGNTSRRGFENLLEDSVFLGVRLFDTLDSATEPAYASLTRLESRVKKLAKRREETWAFAIGAFVLIALIY